MAASVVQGLVAGAFMFVVTSFVVLFSILGRLDVVVFSIIGLLDAVVSFLAEHGIMMDCSPPEQQKDGAIVDTNFL